MNKPVLMEWNLNLGFLSTNVQSCGFKVAAPEGVVFFAFSFSACFFHSVQVFFHSAGRGGGQGEQWSVF